MDNTILNLLISNHNNNILKDAIDTLNSFVEDSEHFKLYLYDENGNSFIPKSKIKPVLVEF